MGPIDSVKGLTDQSEASTQHMYKAHICTELSPIDLGMLGSIWWGYGGIPCQVYPGPRVVTLGLGCTCFLDMDETQ